MNTRKSTKPNFKRLAATLLSIFAILAISLPAYSGTQAQSATPYMVASTLGDWFWTSGFLPGTLDISIYGSTDTSLDPLWTGTAEANEYGFAYVDYPVHGVDLQPGYFLVISDSLNEKSLLLEQVTVEVFDVANDLMAGTAPAGSQVSANAGPQEWQQPITVEADPVSGAWQADFRSIDFDITEEMRIWSYAQVFDEDGDANEGSTPPAPPSSWRDDFEAESLLPGWYWRNGDSGLWDLNSEPGYLRMQALNAGTPDGNLLLRGAADGDFSIETRMLFEPDTNFQIAGLVIWQDAQNFLQLGRAFCDLEGCPGKAIYFDKILGGELLDGNFATPFENPFDPSEAYLRLERRGDMVRALYSHEGITWTEIGIHWLPPEFQVNAVGLTAAQDPDTPDVSAYFDYFELNEGQDFLPEGYHDYSQGDVPSWDCNAGGWAADPDDRQTDLWVEIDVDGVALADWVSAGDFRQDLQDAGVCVDGNCGFSTPLWGTISSYEPHSIVAYAQDIPSGEWVTLSASPKDLTCRTYDIYSFDPQTGITSQVSNLREADEYDPSWSPNGKMVAHDVVTADSHGIYVTDVASGVSTPLAGAEDGGNDAAWSPRGDWIAFDRRWVGDPNIYIVPPGGGDRILLRENAVFASWAPNGMRLVFTDLNDGSIRSIAMAGGKGVERLVAAQGETPAWSPDGKWIAYTYAGEIWKVAVNAIGTPQGEPIQVTSSPFSEGSPTWSADSQTIIYDAGFGGDSDIWTVPAAGGEPTWLTGALVYGDYGPNYSKKTIGFASVSPNGQAARTWAAAFTYDLSADYWSAGTHTYHFEAAGNDNSPDLSFDVSTEESLQDGTVLLRPYSIQARSGEGCSTIHAINPDQPTRFFAGWTTDGTYADALAYYQNLLARVAWDGGLPVDLDQHEVFPLSSVNWFDFACAYTAP